MVFLVGAGIHAREWISPAVSTYLLYQLVTSPEWRDLLKVTEWYIVPVANPDGYQYSFLSPRTRSVYGFFKKRKTCKCHTDVTWYKGYNTFLREANVYHILKHIPKICNFS